MTRFSVLAALLATMVFTAGPCLAAGDEGEGETARVALDERPQRAPTFAADIAPIVHAHCTACHHDGGVAPFPLETYGQVRRRARQIAMVTRSGYMPPWKPDPGYGPFLGERRLREDQIASIERWLESGAELGDASRVPDPPQRNKGWRLGEPDLVVSPSEAFAVPADGPDVFRSFVVPVPAAAGKIVEAIELRPGNARIVHHATIYADATGAARQLDQLDPEPGYPGMQVGVPPGGHFFGWTPGRTPRRLDEGMGWIVEPETDLIVEAHLLPSGKTETVRPQLGLYFTDRRPTKIPVTVRLGSTTIDIPAGAPDYTVRDAYELPVDVHAVAIYPHAHYLGRRLEAAAVLPDGTRRPLIRISDWDFAWQDEYRFASPPLLPRGTRLEMTYVYDNSAGNPRNPFDPPQRVPWGPRSTDEMGDLWLTVLPVDASDRPRLAQSVRARDLALRVQGFERRVERDPRDFDARSRLGQLHLARRELPGALEHLEAALRLRPESWHVHYNLGVVKARLGRVDEAVRHYRAAAAANPGRARVHNNLGALLMLRGEDEAAAAAFRDALAVREDLHQARLNLGVVLVRLGRPEDAIGEYERILAAKPGYAEAHSNLASAYLRMGRLEDAARHCEEALRIRPRYPAPLKNLALIAVRRGDSGAAVEHLRRAVEIEPRDADAHLLLATQLEESGRREEALSHYRAVVTLVPGHEEGTRGAERLQAPGPSR